jgi:signal transduction histidine kinase
MEAAPERGSLKGKVQSRRSLSLRLLAGLAVTLTAALVYSFYTAAQIKALRQFQTQTADRNRTDSLLLLRIQNDLNSLDLALRDMLDRSEPYPLYAWDSQLRRIRADLDDAVARESRYASAARTADQSTYLSSSLAQFWDSAARVMELSKHDEDEARTQIRLSLQARQAALSTAVSRLLTLNNEEQEQGAQTTERIYDGVERNLYIFLAALVVVMVATGSFLLHYNQRLLNQVTALAQQLISMQENTFRSISRDLHDDLGQVLTAIGLMLQRIHGRAAPGLRDEVRETQLVVQSTLEKVRSLSQALHPVMIDEVGLEDALNTYLPVFETRTGVAVKYQKTGVSRPIDREVGIHVYRVLQESLNNVVRHSGSREALVRLNLQTRSLTLEVEDHGVGLQSSGRTGLGLVSMRERAGILGGKIEILDGPEGGTLVRLTVPLAKEESHAHA